MEAHEILDIYEKNLNFKQLKNMVRKASDAVLWDEYGLFSCLTDSDNALPQLLRMDYKRRFELLVIMTHIKNKSDSYLLELEDEVEA
jgi:hypothetical protein